MGQKVFIPLTDELIFDRPELISGPVRPYNEKFACYHWLDVRVNPQDDEHIAESINSKKQQQTTQKERIYPHTVAA